MENGTRGFDITPEEGRLQRIERQLQFLDKEQAGTDTIMERFNKQLDASNLHSPFFWTRAFAVWGHYAAANFAITMAILVFALIVSFISNLVG